LTGILLTNRFLDAPEIHRPVDVKVIDKAVDRIVEVFQKKPVAKVQLISPPT
jgi:hypothetical protein